MLNLSGTILNVLHKPIHATVLALSQVFLVFLPLALVGERYFSLLGVFGAMSISYLTVGNLARVVVRRELTRAFLPFERLKEKSNSLVFSLQREDEV
jgi:Na+-driven multidrug efflux pump